MKFNFRVAIFLSCMAAYYLELPLFFGGGSYVPSAFTFVLVAFIYALKPPRWQSIDFNLIFFLSSLLAINVLFAGIYFPLGPRINGAAQMLAAVFSGIVFFRFASTIESQTLERVFFICAVVLVLMATIEVLGFLPISDSFRNIAYSQGGYGVYAAEERDLALAGFIRPKVFASEPSLLAIGFTSLTSCWLVIRPTGKRFICALAMCFYMLYLTGSPITLAGILICAATYFYLNFFAGGRRLGYLPFAVFAMIPLVWLMYARFSERFLGLASESISYELTSENLRIVFPFVSVADVFEENFWMGLGVGGKRSLEVISSLGLGWEAAFGNNNIAAILISFGVLGACLFLFCLFRYVRAVSGNFFLFLIFFSALSFSMGGLETARYWGYLFLYVLALSKAYSKANGDF